MFLIDWIGGSWQTTAALAAGTVLLYVGALWLTLIFWTFRDSRRRSRSAVFQAASVALVAFFFVFGLWLYLLMRPRLTLTQQYAAALEEEALLQELDEVLNCPGCNRRVHEEYIVCPSCLIELKTPCKKCEKPLAHAWLACPFCGTRRRPQQVAPRVAAAATVEPLTPEEIPAMANPSHAPAAGAGGGA
ncbi:MAG TPA: zinc ribbon domain-containing protein [Tepidiformaceae bacterium]|nr:zinc ribbon domain-containing protein [Tepidiformaceae bacterium]